MRLETVFGIQTKSSMVITGFFSYGSFERRHQLSPLRISFCIPMTISSLIFPATGCTSPENVAVEERRGWRRGRAHVLVDQQLHIVWWMCWVSSHPSDLDKMNMIARVLVFFVRETPWVTNLPFLSFLPSVIFESCSIKHDPSRFIRASGHVFQKCSNLLLKLCSFNKIVIARPCLEEVIHTFIEITM